MLISRTTRDISVIITVYNTRRFLRAAVQSVLAEGITCLECIVVDDGSTDGSLETISDLGVERVVLSPNRGFTAALNAGLAAAKGKLVTFLDSDDLLAPGGLRWRADWLAAHAEARAVGGRPAEIIGADGATLGEYPHVLHPEFSTPSELTLDFFRQGGAYPVMLWNYLFRRDLMDEVGKFDETFRIASDFEYLTRVMRVTPIPIVLQPTVRRRLHESNLSLERRKGDYALRKETIDECRRVLSPLGVEPSKWILWEKGYRE